MLNPRRASFRQLLVIAFLVIAALLAAVSMRGLSTLDQLLSQSREAAQRAVRASADAQVLAERGTAMERSARQYVVLDDRVLRERFGAAAHDAQEALSRLESEGLPAALVATWRQRLDAVDAQLGGPRSTASARDELLAGEFREMHATGVEIGERVRRTAEERNQTLVAAQERARRRLGQQVLGAIILAVVLALAFGLWLAKPLQRLERAIVGLGENRLDVPIEIRGPLDVREVGRRLDWLRIRLADLEADKARFLRHVSHELKTPLAALREGVALLEEGVAGTLSDSQREVARILRQNTAALQRQIEALLRFNAAAFEARSLVRRKTELGELVHRLIDEQSMQWRARKLKVNVTGGPLWSDVDADKLAVALSNLLSNAIRFSPVGGNIDVSLWRHPQAARIEIWDEGPGVAEADRERVFEPFYRGERQPADALRGSGIGLSIVNEYVAAHGGRVELLSEGPGARFRIELPHATTS